MGYTERLSEQLAIVGTVDPDANTAGTASTDVIDMKLHRRVLFIVMAGELGSSGTLDFSVKGDTASNGSFATTITGKAITQMTQAGTDADKQAMVEVTAEEVAQQNLRYIRGDLVTATATSDSAVIALADSSRYTPGASLDLASVDEIVA